MFNFFLKMMKYEFSPAQNAFCTLIIANFLSIAPKRRCQKMLPCECISLLWKWPISSTSPPRGDSTSDIFSYGLLKIMARAARNFSMYNPLFFLRSMAHRCSIQDGKNETSAPGKICARRILRKWGCVLSKSYLGVEVSPMATSSTLHLYMKSYSTHKHWTRSRRIYWNNEINYHLHFKIN